MLQLVEVLYYVPDELVLKKNIVALVNASNMSLCKFVETFIKNETKKATLTNTTTTKATDKTA